MRLTARRWLSLTAVIAASATVAACSSSSSTTNAGASSGASSSSTNSGVAYAQQMVTKLEATTSTYPVPSASISGVSTLKGKTIFYIPLDAHIPGFVITAIDMKQALTAAGLKFQECDGSSNPTSIASCVNQAEGANAAGIITDAIPYGMAQNAFDAAKGKGIPIIIADQYAPSGTTNTDSLSYVQGVVDQPSQIAYWMVASTGGKANAILGEEEDSQSSEEYMQNALPIFSKYCSGCTVSVKMITASMTDSQITASVTSNLQSNPNATLYYTEFEDSLQDTTSGIQAAGKSSTVGIAVAGGSTNGLGLLKNGQGVKAVVAVDQAYEGYALTDEILRMAAKSTPVTETIPSRLFSSDNVGTIQVTQAAEDSGAWFGDNSFQSDFEKLWGIG
jgi:ribose transport system substrate-binding protein